MVVVEERGDPIEVVAKAASKTPSIGLRASAKNSKVCSNSRVGNSRWDNISTINREEASHATTMGAMLTFTSLRTTFEASSSP